jgi:hypothetical protein
MIYSDKRITKKYPYLTHDPYKKKYPYTAHFFFVKNEKQIFIKKVDQAAFFGLSGLAVNAYELFGVSTSEAKVMEHESDIKKIYVLSTTHRLSLEFQTPPRSFPPINSFGAVLSSSIYPTTKYSSFPANEESIEGRIDANSGQYTLEPSTTFSCFGPTNFQKRGIFVLACSNLQNDLNKISTVLYIQEPEQPPLTNFFDTLKQRFEKRINLHSPKLFNAKLYKSYLIYGLEKEKGADGVFYPKKLGPNDPLPNFTFLSQIKTGSTITIPMSYVNPPLAVLTEGYLIILHAESITSPNKKKFTIRDSGSLIDSPTNLTAQQTDNIVSPLYFFSFIRGALVGKWEDLNMIVWFTKKEIHFFHLGKTTITTRPMPEPFNKVTDVITACAEPGDGSGYNFFVAYERTDPKTKKKTQFVQAIEMVDFIGND